MLNIGCHLSSAKGYLHMGEEALALGANTFQFFTRNPRGGRAKAIDTEDIRALLALMRENSFAPLLAHAPYTLNACSADSKIRDFARMVMTEDLQLLELLPGTRYNFHPGSHVKQGAEQGIIMIAELLNEILRPQQQTMVLLETMAGKGSEVGRNFTELRSIIDRVELQGKLGVCLDTCHVLVALCPAGVVALNVLPRQGVVRPDKDSLVAADCKFPTFTQTATRFTPLQRIACPKGSTKNSNPQYVAGTFCAVGFMPPE